MKGKYIKILKAIIYASLVLLAISTTLLLYWLYQPSNVIEFREQPIPSRVDGRTVILHINYCKNVSATGRVRTSFVSSSREVFLPAYTDRQPAQCINTEFPILIPKELPADTYRIHFRVDYTINPIKRVVNESDSTQFKVPQ